MQNDVSKIKYQISLAEYCLKRADREWAYYKNGRPMPGGGMDPDDNPQKHYLASQKEYAAAKEHAAKALEMMSGKSEPELERRARAIIDKCNHNK